MRYWILAFACLTVGACQDNRASWDTTESARQQAQDNAEFNAQIFRNANFPDLSILMRGDSTIDRSCPQGDGWASIDLVAKGDGVKTKIKCSTVSASIGCMTEEDFKARKQYASQDNHCNPEIPFPLPKIVK